MTIEKGMPWGSVQPAPHDVVIASDEASAAQAFRNGARYVALQSGDLLRALGKGDGIGAATLAGNCLVLPCDVFRVTLDEHTEVVAVSSVMVGSRWKPRWWVTSGGFLGDLNVAPRAHPNDGFADALRFDDVTMRTLWAMRRRMRLGDHLPHPRLTMTRAAEVLWQGARSAPVWVDGKLHGRFRNVQIVVQSDAFSLCVPQ